jgi:hypothetical protein
MSEWARSAREWGIMGQGSRGGARRSMALLRLNTASLRSYENLRRVKWTGALVVFLLGPLGVPTRAEPVHQARAFSCAQLWAYQGQDLDPDFLSKVLAGEVGRVQTNLRTGKQSVRFIGGHSPAILRDPRYRVTQLLKNADGTMSVKFQARVGLPTGETVWSNIKSSTLAPEGWSDERISQAIASTRSAEVVYVSRAGDSYRTALVDGVEWELISGADGRVRAAFPTGGRPTWPSARGYDTQF